MKVNKLALAASGVILFLSVAPLPANAIVFNVEGTFNDTGTYSGSFDYNNQTQDIMSWNIKTTQGFKLSGTTYNNVNPNASVRVFQNVASIYPTNVLFLFTNNLGNLSDPNVPVGTLYEQALQFLFPNQSLADFNGGPIGDGPETWFTKTGPFSGIGIQRSSAMGSVTPIQPVPEPTTTFSLFAIGFGTVLKRKLKPSKSTEKETEKTS